MGADIHMVLEKRILPPGKMPGCEEWVGVNAFPYVQGTVYKFRSEEGGPNSLDGRISWAATGRNYNLFADLAGVRGDGPAPRGVPDDVSLLALHAIAEWDADGHSHTWLTLDEALPLFIKNGQFGEPSHAVLNAMKNGLSVALAQYGGYFWNLDEQDDLADYRLIMWFDN